MKKYFLLSTVFLCALTACSESTQNDQTDSEKSADNVLHYVDPFIGTAGDHGQLHPAAMLPFGMIQVGPDTVGKSHSGYDFEQNELLGFSHNRSAGVGCRGSGGDLLLLASYSNRVSADNEFNPVALNKEQELATPGYYKTAYGEDAIIAEMTASASSGWQRYTFPKAGEVLLMGDLSHSHDNFYSGSYRIVEGAASESFIFGSIEASTVCRKGKYQVHFSLGTSLNPEQIKKIGDHQFALVFNVEAGQQLLVQTAFSSIDSEHADSLRKAESANDTFLTVKQNAEQLWRDKLNRFALEGGEDYKKLFYTHLYHTYSSPFKVASQGEKYRAPDNAIYTSDVGDHYLSWSIWDTFRTKFPLLTITDPEAMIDITRSLARLYSQGKQAWATETEPYLTVRTEHSGIVLLDAWNKGIAGFNPEDIISLLSEEADALERKSPDQVLEAAYDDWAVAEFANIIGDDDLANKYRQRASSYRPLWLEKFKVMDENSDIMHGDGLYEGTLWQYRWFVPFDTQWLVEQLGGNEGFSTELSTFFAQELYNMGNQPDIQSPFMFNFSSAPWKTQQIVNQILTKPMNHWYGTHEKFETPYFGKAFDTSPKGYIREMDDDDGTMAAWFVFASMGLYPAAPGLPLYSLHTPIFSEVTINHDNGDQFQIVTHDFSEDNIYIQKTVLNDMPLERAWLSHAEIMQSGKLEIWLGSEPNKQWGTDDVLQTSLEEVATH